MCFLLFWSLAKRREVISPNFLHLLQLAKLGKIGHSLIHRQVLMVERLTEFFSWGFPLPSETNQAQLIFYPNQPSGFRSLIEVEFARMARLQI